VFLTPSLIETSALYQVIRSAVIEGQPEATSLDIERAAREWGATFTRLRPLYESGKLSAVWLSTGPLSVFMTPEKCRELYQDMREVERLSSVSLDAYLNLAMDTASDC
jgi:hypothetical protein